ncbi:MAG: hypothetical protein M2R45_02997 [Verrucomicrobia subdivision 3 bacterium]|nr:hypothetical protein [Limisphaerales bacterium]MCS1416517.1 hypothetical protein [Limisphaerales bacterium]
MVPFFQELIAKEGSEEIAFWAMAESSPQGDERYPKKLS